MSPSVAEIRPGKRGAGSYELNGVISFGTLQAAEEYAKREFKAGEVRIYDKTGVVVFCYRT